MNAFGFHVKDCDCAAGGGKNKMMMDPPRPSPLNTLKQYHGLDNSRRAVPHVLLHKIFLTSGIIDDKSDSIERQCWTAMYLSEPKNQGIRYY